MRHGGVRHLYYQGWQRTERTPYLIFIGLAVDDERSAGLRNTSRDASIMDRTADDPFLSVAPLTSSRKATRFACGVCAPASLGQ